MSFLTDKIEQFTDLFRLQSYHQALKDVKELSGIVNSHNVIFEGELDAALLLAEKKEEELSNEMYESFCRQVDEHKKPIVINPEI